MLTDDLKERIQSLYRTLLKNKGYRPRVGQRLMIAEIAKTLGNIEEDASGVRLGESHICMVEAGTGTGKTLSYMLSALPVALEKNKKLVVATATVLLQEQLVQRDLPDLLEHGELPFSFSIAKGRGRYVCNSKLDSVLDANSALDPTQALFEDELAAKLDDKATELYEDMLKAIASQEWNGDRDSWDTAVSNADWQRITTDHRQCTNRQCAHFKDCSYFLSRREINEADVVVANHDLVLADMSLGGGVLLPKPEETIYIFDEAHHLPDKALSHFNYHVRLKAAKQWVAQIPKLLAQIAGQLGHVAELQEQIENLPALQKEVEENLIFAQEIVTGIVDHRSQTDERQWRFEKGSVPPDLRVIAKNLSLQYSRICVALEQVGDCLMDKSKNDLDIKPIIDRQYPRLAAMTGRCQAAYMLWQSYAQAEQEPAQGKAAPTARWIVEIDMPGQNDYELWSSPVMASDLLGDILWSKCFGSVLTSATLSTLNCFDRIRMRMGLPEGTSYKVVPSPFKYRECATFEVPAGAADPRQSQFEQVLIEQLNGLIDPDDATLVIFTARAQMYAVLKGLDSAIKEQLIVQDDYSKQVLVRKHRERIDAGEGSIIFGLSSLTEGIDLPGNYVNHVIIAKLPFTVPSDPVEATLTEWLQEQGRDPFWEISVPDASLRLKQACGRLLRSEKDSGKITLLDRRILTKRYGKAMLDALPDYQRVIG